MKLTKNKIECMANEIMDFLKENELSEDVNIYFNNKRIDRFGICRGEYDPHDYFEYAAYDHIMSMSFESELCHILNGFKANEKVVQELESIMRKYGVYMELGNTWNGTCYLLDDNTEVEYTHYKRPQERRHIYNLNNESIPKELRAIGMAWQSFQEKVGDVGSCVLGAGFEFEYKGQEYFLSPCSKYQGSVSWETDKDTIQNMLQAIGATNIRYEWGVMD